MAYIVCYENDKVYEFDDRIYKAMRDSNYIIYINGSWHTPALRTEEHVMLWRNFERACKVAGII